MYAVIKDTSSRFVHTYELSKLSAPFVRRRWEQPIRLLVIRLPNGLKECWR